jgi:hypothetical protein
MAGWSGRRLFQNIELTVPGTIDAVCFGFIADVRHLGCIHFRVELDFTFGTLELKVGILVFGIFDVKILRLT